MERIESSYPYLHDADLRGRIIFAIEINYTLATIDHNFDAIRIIYILC